MPNRINVTWHEAHKMPPRPTLDERIEWHLEHRRACACRTDLPASIAAEVDRRGIAPAPERAERG